jgi:molybdopterin-biosynthesis enzyme MoeA-like protein
MTTLNHNDGYLAVRYAHSGLPHSRHKAPQDERNMLKRKLNMWSEFLIFCRTK